MLNIPPLVPIIHIMNSCIAKALTGLVAVSQAREDKIDFIRSGSDWSFLLDEVELLDLALNSSDHIATDLLVVLL